MPRLPVLSLQQGKGIRTLDTKCRLALFDFDGTMAPGDSIVAYMRLAVRQKKVSVWRFAYLVLLALPYYMGFLSEEAYKNIALRFYGRLTPPEKTGIDQAFAEQVMLPRVYAAARERLAKKKAEGCLCLLVSASTENYMRFIAEGLGFDALLCTFVGPDGKVGKNCKGEEKVRRVKGYLAEKGLEAELSISFAYADSKSDLPILHWVGHPTLVNPKRGMKKAAPGIPMEKWQ